MDQIDGWTTTGIGHGYGKSHSARGLAKRMRRM